MARQRKQLHDPRQMSLFDAMVHHIEQIRKENIQDDMREEAQSMSSPRDEQRSVTTLPASERQNILEDRQAKPFRGWFELLGDSPKTMTPLGLNGRGETVYEMGNGVRMYSRNPEFMQTVDGDGSTPEELFLQNNHNFLTIQEVVAFRQQHSPSLERQYAGQVDKPSGHRKNRTQAGNNQRNQDVGIQQFSLFNSGSLGAELPGRTEGAGSERRAGLDRAAGSAEEQGAQSAVQRDSPAGEPAGDVGLGNSGELRGGTEPVNYRITPEDRLGVGGAKSKYADNVAAIRLLQQLQADGVKLATPEEKKTLVRFVGWGGLPQVFDAKNEQWAAEYRELQGILSPGDYAAARRSTQDAHYTSEAVIRAMYQGLSRLGVGSGKKLNVLEPSAGIGNFIGLCPEEFNARFLAVELDPTTAAIAKYLYPQAHHLNNAFQNTSIRAAGFDLIIGNPPFGQQSLYDPDFPELKKFSIHNYFLAKSMRLLREGGIAAFVVSRYFMDAADSSAREYIADQADFLGAVRLPETAFRQNALTDVQ